MRQAELASIVHGLKSDFSAPNGLDRKTVGSRANNANLAALEMLVDSCDAAGSETSLHSQAHSLKELSNELWDIARVVEDLGASSKS